jgi:hypothetical protein
MNGVPRPFAPAKRGRRCRRRMRGVSSDPYGATMRSFFSASANFTGVVVTRSPSA